MLNQKQVDGLASQSHDFIAGLIDDIDNRLAEILSNYITITEEGIEFKLDHDLFKSAYSQCSPEEQSEIDSYLKLSSMLAMLEGLGYYPTLLVLLSMNTLAAKKLL